MALSSASISGTVCLDVSPSGGTLTLQDLQAYQTTVSDAWAFPLGDYQVYIPPPPTGAVFLSLVLNIMKGGRHELTRGSESVCFLSGLT